MVSLLNVFRLVEDLHPRRRFLAISIDATIHWIDRLFRLVARGCRPFSTEIEHTGSISGRYEPQDDNVSVWVFRLLIFLL